MYKCRNTEFYVLFYQTFLLVIQLFQLVYRAHGIFMVGIHRTTLNVINLISAIQKKTTTLKYIYEWKDNRR